MSQISSYPIPIIVPPGGFVETLTGNSGGAVSPTAGNINVVGDTTTVNVVGDPGTSTLTISTASGVATSFPTDSGTATPSAGVLYILANDFTDNCGSTVLFSAPAGNVVRLNVTDSLFNTFIGNVAGNASLTTANTNTGVGYGTFLNVTTSTGSDAFGSGTLSQLTTGSGNAFFGSGSGGHITTSLGNVGVGLSSLIALTTGSGLNTSLGFGSSLHLQTGTKNIAVGASSASAWTSSESSNIAIGNSGVVSESNVIHIGTYGNGSGQQEKCYIAACYSNFGTGNTFVGELAGNTTLTVADAISNVSVGYNSLSSLSDGDSNVMVGEVAGTSITTGSSNVGLGISSLSSLISGSNNLALGTASGSNYTGSESDNILLGNDGTIADAATIRIGTSGTQTTAYIAGVASVTTSNSEFVTIDTTTGQLGSTASGGGGITTINGDSGSVTGSTVTFTNNTDAGQTVAFIGSGTTMKLIMTDARSNVFLATGAPYSGTSLGEMSVVIGPQAVTSGNAERCVVIGWRAGMSLDSGGFSSTEGNVIIGSSAGQVLQTGNNNILIGEGAGQNYSTSESSNICLNSDGGAGENNTLRIGNGTGGSTRQLAQAFISGINGVTTSNSLMVTIDSSSDQLGVASIPAAGISALTDNFGGVASGSSVDFTADGSTSGGTVSFTASASSVQLNFLDISSNVAIGTGLTYTSAASIYCVSLGNGAGGFLTSASSGNTAIGTFALSGIFGGNSNVAIGYNAGISYNATESSNITIGANTAGTNGESHVLRIGSATGTADSQLSSAYIAGINGSTISSPTAVFIDTATDQLSTNLSSIRFKENIVDMDDYSSKIYNLRPVTFNYKDKPTKYQLPGLIAEEVDKIMPELSLYDKDGAPLTVRYHDLPALLLNEVQKLRKELDELKGSK